MIWRICMASLASNTKFNFKENHTFHNSIRDSIVELRSILQMLENEHYDQSIDWWSFAVLLYRMLTGKVCTYMSFFFLKS